MWGCRPHWFRLPGRLRKKIWSTYRTGQEIDKNPSDEYLAVAKEVEAWCIERNQEHAKRRARSANES